MFVHFNLDSPNETPIELPQHVYGPLNSPNLQFKISFDFTRQDTASVASQSGRRKGRNSFFFLCLGKGKIDRKKRESRNAILKFKACRVAVRAITRVRELVRCSFRLRRKAGPFDEPEPCASLCVPYGLRKDVS